MTEKHLWEVDHPYSCSDTNFFSNEYSWEYASWNAFLQAMGDADMDLNLLFRWDWKDATNPDYDYLDQDELQLFYMQQRKGIFAAVRVSVVKRNEAEVRSYLEKHWLHLQKLWTPLGEVMQTD